MRYLILLLIIGCAQVDKEGIQIVTTIQPLAEFAGEVAGTQAEIHQLLPIGANPHTWEPKPSDLRKLADADIFIYVGADFEPWVESIPIKAKKIEFAELVEVHDEEHAHDEHHDLDPHMWLSFENDKTMVNRISAELAAIDSGNKMVYDINAAAYNNKLSKLDEQYGVLRKCPLNSFIVGGHSAFGYLAEAYGLEQVAVSGLSPDAEPSSQNIAQVLDIISEKGLKNIVFEEFTSPRVSQVLIEETSVQSHALSPGVTSVGSFIDVMEDNLETLKTVLECK